MAHAGQTITNPVTGERITFLETTEATQGERLLFDCRVAPQSSSLPPHIHETQDEHLEVFSGTLGVLLGDNVFNLDTGYRITLPKGIRHQWWNAGNDELRMRVEVVPPRRLEAVLEAVAGMAHDGKLRANGMPRNPFLLTHLLRLSETFTPSLPLWPQKLALAITSAVGGLLGYDPTFTAYRARSHAPMERIAERVTAGPDHTDAA